MGYTKEQRRVWSAKYREKNREAIREYQKQWERENRLKGTGGKHRYSRTRKNIPYHKKEGTFIITFD
tara:strand:- start:6675 stop:6875 length:201 start_codon:yes stop_codon:yes gene_type:complete